MVAVHDTQLNYLSPLEMIFLKEIMVTMVHKETFIVSMMFSFDDNYSKDQITSRYWWYAGDDWPGPGRYHSQWLLRSKEAEYDYTALINLLKTVKTVMDTQKMKLIDW